jgi:hypothetical protein
MERMNPFIEMTQGENLKVLMVISQFHPIIGGAEKQAKLLANKLIKKGVSVTILTGWWKYGTPHREIVDGMIAFRNFSCWGMFGIKGIRILRGLIYMVTLSVYHQKAILSLANSLYCINVGVFVWKI